MSHFSVITWFQMDISTGSSYWWNGNVRIMIIPVWSIWARNAKKITPSNPPQSMLFHSTGSRWLFLVFHSFDLSMKILHLSPIKKRGREVLQKHRRVFLKQCPTASLKIVLEAFGRNQPFGTWCGAVVGWYR